MFQKSLFPLFILCLSFTAYSQPSITMGKPYKVLNGQGKFYFYKENELLAIKKDEGQLFIQKINTENLSYVSMTQATVPLGFENIKEINGRYFMFYSDNRGLSVREIDFKSGGFINEGKQIISATKVVGNTTTFGAFGIPEKASGKYNIFVSNDKSFIAIQYRFKPEIKDDNKSHEIVGLHVFDNNFQVQSSSKLTMPYTEKKMNNLTYSIDSDGSVYIVTSVYDDDTTDEKKVNSEEPNYHLEILTIALQSTNFTTTKVNLEDNFVKTLRLYESQKGVMTCIGFYNKGKKSTNVDGIIQFKLTQDGKFIDIKTFEIPLEILNQYVSSNEQKKNLNNEVYDIAEFENLELREVHFYANGGMLIISEQAEKKITYHSSYNAIGGTTGYTTKTYSDGDILVSKIDSVGKMTWMKRLPKGRVSGSEGKTFYYLTGKGQHHFLFLDKMKNFELPMNKPHSTNQGWGDILMAYSINDETGKTSKTAILDLRNVNEHQLYQFTPNRIEEIAPSVFVFEAYKKHNEDVLIKVDMSK